MRKRILSIITVLTSLALCSCGQTTNDPAVTTEPSTEAATEAALTSEFPAMELSVSWETDPMFDTYVSNTVIATGSNKFISEAKSMTYRAWIPVEEYGSFEYAFYFSNTVDSTWERGTRQGYVGMPGGAYEIESAYIYDGGESFEDEPLNKTAVTFEGSASKSVASGETFWSDPVEFDVPEGHYLLWEWTITGEDIPCICMSGMTHAYADKGQGFYYVNEIPLPVLFGCNRPVSNTVIPLGDSITQGCETTENACEFWAAEISKALGTDTSLWNLGLGYSRATDAAQGGDWLQRARYADTVIVAFGTNDIITGKYGEVGSTSAVRIKDALESITTVLTDAGCNVILMSAPPFDMIPEMEAIRTELNTYIPEIAETNDKVYYFDFASLLEDPDNTSA
ncbi:MAG: SGNH/GDSL hydrolase family protein, partial [Oscillospiraceae bacterium]|nr:SGNH/GDSL hydrolase family protein [Oscillospiraceae bacterium]